MKKIGIITSLMTSYGGVQTCVISLIKALNENKIIPSLISDTIPNQRILDENKLNVNHVRVDFSIKRNLFKRFFVVLNSINEFVYFFKTSWLSEEYDFIYIFQPNILVDTNIKHLYYLSMSPVAISFSKMSVLSRVKNITYHLFVKRFHPVFEFQNKNCVINSNYTADYFEKYFFKRIEVIYPSNSIDSKILEKKFDKEKKSVLFFSRIAPDKRPEQVLLLAKKFPHYSFYIIGGISDMNYVNNLQNSIRQNQLNNVKIFKNLPYLECIDLLKKMEYYVFTAQNEHFGITTVEAIMYGAIPLVHNSGGQREIVPFNELRYEDNSIIDSFNNLITKNEKEKKDIQRKLNLHMLNFTEEVFMEKMIKYIY